jgi:putative FmdB family regulatory protein
MPTYEYFCDQCEILFEELFLTKKEAEEHIEECVCQFCGQSASRVPSVTNFQFKGTAEGDPSRIGNSGVHDLDYPTLDKAIGRSANRKWKEYHERKKTRDKVRREHGTTAVSIDQDGHVEPTNPKKLETREKALKLWKKARQQNPT